MSEVIELYNGEVRLSFDADTHAYRVTDLAMDLFSARLPSVTSVLGVIAKPALVGWAAGMAANWFRDNLEPGRKYTEVEIADMVRKARRAHTDRKEKSADEGTIIHEYIERFIKHQLGLEPSPPQQPLDDRIRAAIEMFHAWVDKHHVHFILSEQKVYSRDLQVVGTADLLMEVDGVLTIGDIKTGKTVYPEYALQMAAYWYALEEQGHLPEHSIKQGIILRIGRDGTGMEVVNVIPDKKTFFDHLDAFMAARRLYSWKQEYGR